MSFLKKFFFVFLFFFISLLIPTIALAVDTCAGFYNADPTHSEYTGVCYYALRSGESPGYTTDPSKQDCTNATVGPFGVPVVACGTIPDCNKIAGGTAIGITDDITHCNGDLGNSYKCCSTGAQPSPSVPPPPCTGTKGDINTCASVNTGLGTISVDPASVISAIFGVFLGISGGVAIVIIIISGYKIIVAQGDPEKLQAARESITSAIIGLLFVIFSVVILKVIGVDILHLPGLNP